MRFLKHDQECRNQFYEGLDGCLSLTRPMYHGPEHLIQDDSKISNTGMALAVGLHKRTISRPGKANKTWKCGKIWFIIIHGVAHERESIELAQHPHANPAHHQPVKNSNPQR